MIVGWWSPWCVTWTLVPTSNCPDHRVVVVHLTNHMRCMCATEYHKWAEVIVRFSCKAMGVTLAWLLQRITSAIHCALRGAKLFASSAQVLVPSPLNIF